MVRCTFSGRAVWAAWVALGLPPVHAAPPVVDEAAYEHVVERGDTLIGLQHRLLQPGVGWRKLQRLNGVADPRRLQVGRKLRIPAALLKLESVPAEMLHVHGDVMLTHPGAAPVGAAGGETVSAGDEIRVGSNGSAVLRLADGARIVLHAGTRLRAERLLQQKATGAGDARLRLQEGAVDARVPAAPVRPRFELQTPVVNLGVRGTDFRARLEPAQMFTEVLEGRVVLGATRVDAGQGAVATGAGTGAPRPLPAPPDLSALPERIEKLPLELSLGAAGTLRALVVDARGLVLLEARTADGVARWPDDLADGRYELRVRRADAEGIEGEEARRGFVLKARPEPPFIVAPRADAVVTEPTVRLRWTAHPQAAHYRLQVADDPGFVAPRLDRSDIAAIEFAAELPLGTHHWRVATVRADGDTGPWSQPEAFTRAATPPPAPPAAEPPVVADDNLVLRWRGDGPGARYRLQISTDADFARLLVDDTVEDTSFSFAKPPPGTYHLRVRTIAPDGTEGPWGSGQTADVPRPWWWLLVPATVLLLLL
jgi:hypothetical protein